MTVGHVGINVNDVEISKEFYINLFDFEIIGESKEEGKKYVFLGNDSQILITLWEQSDKKFSSSNAGLHHLAFVLKDLAQLEEFEKKIEKQNVKKIYNGIVSHAEGASSGGLFFLDPDNTRLEVYITDGLHECDAANGSSSCGFF